MAVAIKHQIILGVALWKTFSQLCILIQPNKVIQEGIDSGIAYDFDTETQLETLKAIKPFIS